MRKNLEYMSNQKFFQYYKKLYKHRKQNKENTIRTRTELLEVNSAIWNAIREDYIDNEGGVFINGMGYFCHVIAPNYRFRISNLTGKLMYPNTGGYRYRHTMLNDLPKSQSKVFFHMMHDMKKSVQNKCKELMNKGRRYKFCFNEICSYIKQNGKKRNRIPIDLKK